jgi:hypothetical protein
VSDEISSKFNLVALLSTLHTRTDRSDFGLILVTIQFFRSNCRIYKASSNVGKIQYFSLSLIFVFK